MLNVVRQWNAHILQGSEGGSVMVGRYAWGDLCHCFMRGGQLD